METTKSRDVGLDVTRILAYVTVLSVHFFLNSEFYDTPVQGWRMYILGALRTLCMICVPLFMLLTGYLSAEKRVEISPKGLLHCYSRLVPILLAYMLSDVLILLAKHFCLGENVTWQSGIQNILSYDQYAWYMNMYLGLALMIPFLNVLWNGLKSKQEQQALVLLLLAMTMLPTVLNAAVKLVPDWWTSIYPITYYYIGAYLKKNVEIQKLSTAKLSGALLISWCAFSALDLCVTNWGGGTTLCVDILG